MNDQTSLEMQLVQLNRLLVGAEDDPIMAPQLRARINATQKKLDETKRQPSTLLSKNLSKITGPTTTPYVLQNARLK